MDAIDVRSFELTMIRLLCHIIQQLYVKVLEFFCLLPDLAHYKAKLRWKHDCYMIHDFLPGISPLKWPVLMNGDGQWRWMDE